MVFTDDNIRQLKQNVKDAINGHLQEFISPKLHVEYMEALLSRLEAAENLAALAYWDRDKVEDEFTIHRAAEAWRKVAGR